MRLVSASDVRCRASDLGHPNAGRAEGRNAREKYRSQVCHQVLTRSLADQRI